MTGPLLPLRCFKCAKRLEPVMDGTTQPHGGLTFISTGNYGSTVFDPFSSGEQLHAVICDVCVTDWADRLVAVTASHPRPTFDYRPVKSMDEFAGDVEADE